MSKSSHANPSKRDNPTTRRDPTTNLHSAAVRPWAFGGLLICALTLTALYSDPLLAAAKLESSQLENGSLGILSHGLLYSTWGLLPQRLFYYSLILENTTARGTPAEKVLLRDWVSFLDCATPLVGSVMATRT